MKLKNLIAQLQEAELYVGGESTVIFLTDDGHEEVKLVMSGTLNLEPVVFLAGSIKYSQNN